MCIYHHAYKFETQVFKNHHKLMSLEMQSHFPPSPAKEESKGGDRQDWEEEKAGRGNGQRQEWSWRLATDAGARLPPRDFSLITSSCRLCCRLSQLQPPTSLLVNSACAKTPEHLEWLASSILCRHLGCAQLPLPLAQPQPQSLLDRCSRACMNPRRV